MGSNFLGNTIAEDMCDIGIRGKILQYVDFSNNSVSEEVISKIEDTIISAGSSFFPKFDEVSEQNYMIR